MDIGFARLMNQRIATPWFTQPGEVVAWLGAMQAQDYTGALWSIGLRMTGATERSIEQAIVDRAIVRTWPMRGTLHFVAAQDVRWLLTLLTPRLIAGSAGRYRQLELDENIFAHSQEVFVAALQGGKGLTREELLHQLDAAGIATTGQRGYYLLVHAAQNGLLCFGPMQGKQQTFVLLDEWVPPTQPLGREEALAELTRRYFTSHGPATLPDFTGWAGLTVTEAKIGLAGAGNALIQETVDHRTYWLPHSTPTGRNDTPSGYLLPGFDEYILGYKERSAVLDPAFNNHICPGGNGVFQPTIVVDGQVVGTWKRVVKKGKALITPSPFHPMGEAESARLAVAAERYGAFLGVRAELTK
jgi:hypothetical protein